MVAVVRGLHADDPMAASSSASASRPLGTFILGAQIAGGCPTGFTCNSFTVTSPGILENANGMMADQKPAGRIKGVVVFFSGDTGDSFWSGSSAAVPDSFSRY